MPTSEPYSQGEMMRAFDRMERNIGHLSQNAVTKPELLLHLDGIRQQMKVIDDRYADIAKQLERRDNDVRQNKRIMYGAVFAAVLAVIVPVLLRGVGIT